MSHKKFGPDRFSRFDVYWIQTNRQTDKPNLYIDDSLKNKKIAGKIHEITSLYSKPGWTRMDQIQKFSFQRNPNILEILWY